jgi:hypothetical protein
MTKVKVITSLEASEKVVKELLCLDVGGTGLTCLVGFVQGKKTRKPYQALFNIASYCFYLCIQTSNYL